MNRPTVRIQTGARLHFGLLSHAPNSARKFGGAGMMIDSPGYSVVVAPSEQTVIHASDSERTRIAGVLDRLRTDPAFPAAAFTITIEQSIPEHCGFGSGTQLALAVAQGVMRFAMHSNWASARQLAAWTERGKRSAIGLHGFCGGGFLVDGGKGSSDHPAPLITRPDFPNNWRVVLITPLESQGLAGPSEQTAFDRLPPMNSACTDRLCGLLLLRILPALLEADFATFSEAIFQYGQTAGEYFAPIQGGIYAHPQMRELAEVLRAEGIAGVGQTSWGPTLFAFCEHQSDAEALCRNFGSRSVWSECKWRITQGRNRGAEIRVGEE